MHITTRIPGRANEGMLRKVGGRGFPTLRFLDQDGQVLSEPPGRSVEAFQDGLGMIETFFAAEERLAAGDKEAGYDYLVQGIALGRVSRQEAEQVADGLEITDRKQKAELTGVLAGLEFEEHYGRHKVDRVPIGKELLEMREAGRIPSGSRGQRFYSSLLDHAFMEQDRRLYSKLFKEAKRIYGKERRYKKWIRDADKRRKSIR